MDKVSRISELFEMILQELGRDTKSEELRDTPKRYAKFITDFTSKETLSPKLTVFDSEGADEMIVQEGIPVVSLCAHHTLPFFGTAFIGYIPNGKIVGLSKLARVVRYYSRGLQNQERITRQVGNYLLTSEDLKPKAVGVSIRCYHTCMSIRGVEAREAMTTTTFLSDLLKKDAASRAEFLSRVNHKLF